ncbi:hypothetical protein [uncultured Tateyamaria sp.]|uniref:hypothetical protein n=1 Tax=uncultured Tateyamaria sp. TaxID=455651 RepID=UPI0026154CAB|nr:hypothetical protein [uncultured Tateyamaria sp.]
MSRTGTRALGLICASFAVLCITVWIPLDTDTGLIEKVRRRVEIGDALAPTVAAVFVLMGGLLLALAPGPTEAEDRAPWRGTLGFGVAMLAMIVAGFAVMLVAGPMALALADTVQGSAREYRLLRADTPWKYIGFVLGGVIAISGPICLAERAVTIRALLIGAGAVAGMIALFDLPFDDLLLPPNGDY